jgi:carboxyl-terminal processing protease
MKLKILVLLLLASCVNTLMAQTPDSVKAYIDTALQVMESRSLNGKDLHWNSIRDTVYQMTRNARNYNEAFPALKYAFQQLKDYHGMLANPDSFYRYPPPVDFDKILCDGIKKEFLKGPRIVTAFPDPAIAYLRVPGMNVTQQTDIDDKANKLRDSLCMLLGKHPSGIIIDLRMNSGGNSVPMVSGLGPLFRQKILGYGVDRDGKLLHAVQLATIKNSCTFNKTIPIAVLIGPSTVSSGEILAVYLKQQANVRVFGEPTPGFCTATEGFLFSNNQGYLLMTVNKIADAKKRVYDELLVRPDTYIKSDDHYDDLSADPTVTAALVWLKSRNF